MATRKGPPVAEQKAFLEALAVTANVTVASKAAGWGHQTAYRLRRTSAKFREDWEDALAEGFARLELKLLQRALGQEEELPEGVEAATDRREPSDRVLTTLLNAHRATVAARAERLRADEGSGEEAVALLARKLRAFRAAKAKA